MKQLLVLSGKGGTGKTTLVSSFIRLGEIKAFADCDIDAPNLDLILNRGKPDIREDYYGMKKAYIDQEKCSKCGICLENCQFQAIIKNRSYMVDKYNCEGCGVCQLVCPEEAVSLEDNVAGELELYKDGEVFSRARLKMGEGNSGLLVSQVKKNLVENSRDLELAIIDGSPGIGCPVIASINNVDMVLIVAEASISGLNDLERIVETAEKFQVLSAVCINKCDLNKIKTREIEEYCRLKSIKLLGKIPYDKDFVRALNKGMTPLEYDSKSPASREIVKIYRKTINMIRKGE